MLVFDLQDCFLFEVIIVSGGFVDDSFDDVREVVESLEEHVHQFPAADGVPCFSGEHLKVANILVDVWEVEGKPVEACLGNFLLCGVCEL